MVYLVMVGIGLGTLDMNERFAALIKLIGEDKLLHGEEKRTCPPKRGTNGPSKPCEPEYLSCVSESGIWTNR